MLLFEVVYNQGCKRTITLHIPGLRSISVTVKENTARESTVKRILAGCCEYLTSRLFSVDFVVILYLPESYVANRIDNVVRCFPS